MLGIRRVSARFSIWHFGAPSLGAALNVKRSLVFAWWHRLGEAAQQIHHTWRFAGVTTNPRVFGGTLAWCMVWRRRTGDCHGEAAEVRSYIGAPTLAFASRLVGLLFDVGRPKRFGTTPPPSHNDHAVHYRCSATATNDVTTAAIMMTTKVPRSMFMSILANLEGQTLEGFWSNNGGSGLTIFIVRGEFRA